jgi:hypothetical protein
MNATSLGLPVEFSAATIVDHYDLTFDAGDKANGSLYLCTPRGTTTVRAEDYVQQFRAAGLWSDQPPKTVPDEQRQAYKDGLIFLAAIPYVAGREHVVLARFDHPKFPSDSKRWEAWVDCFDVRHERCR